jgi:hypothetical protein
MVIAATVTALVLPGFGILATGNSVASATTQHPATAASSARPLDCDNCWEAVRTPK